MKVKIWGARGSIPTPLRPDDVRAKIISAFLNVSNIENKEFLEALLSAILDDISSSVNNQSRLLESDPAVHKRYIERRKIVEAYLDRLSPLAGTTAGGNTPCVEVQSGRDLFIIDAGSGIRELGEALMKGECGQGKGVIHLFFSHPHWDHIQGFPFFRPAYVPGNKIFIYGVHDMELALRRQQEFISFPISVDDMQAEIEFVHLEPEGLLEFHDLYVRIKHNHHPGEAYSFRFEKGNRVFVYASDAAYPTDIDLQPYINFFSDADVLIFDAQFTQRESDEKEDWGHSSSFFGVEMAQKANVKNLVLFHHDPHYTDHDLEKILEDTLKFQSNQYPTREPLKVTLAEEGLTFNLMPSPTTQIQQVPGGKVAILKPAGIFDEYVAAELGKQLTALQENSWPPQLIVDLSAVEMLQVAGLRALVKMRKEQQGTSMVLAGPSINVQQLIELAGYLDFFAIYPSVHAALNALKAHETLNLPGQTIKNRYYVEAKMGEGRLGTVFKAIDTRRSKPVALKILSASFSEGAIVQFLNQARQIIDLAHPNIVGIYDCDEDRGLSFMVEELVEGKTLRDLIDEYRGRPLPLVDALGLAESIAYGLEYAHGHGVIHGDLKPKNVLLTEDQIKISDFGLGRLESGKSILNIDVPLAMITARYVAPEQILGHPIDARTDLYALGAMLYELFTGQPLFVGTDEEVLKHHQHTSPKPPRELNPNLSYALEHLVLKLLDKDPNKRYAKASQVRRILTSMITFARGRFTRQRWPTWVKANEAALQQLTDLWTATERGNGQLVFISGEAGVGKTRLTQELTHHVGEATLLIGKCRRLDISSAYHPFKEALTAYFSSTAPEPARQRVGFVLAGMAQLIPEVRLILPSKAPGSISAPKLEPFPVNIAQSGFTSLAELIKQSTKERAWLLILDDLHLADPSSLQLLRYLSHHCRKMSLMIVGTFQSSQLVHNKFLADILNDIQTSKGYASISVDNLSQAGVRQLLQNIWLQEVPHDLATAIYRRTQGNPLFVEEVAKGLVDDGVVSWRDNKWHFAPIVEVGLPKNIQDAIVRRINRLSRETQALLHQAAIMGQTFEFADLHEMSDLSIWDALESIDIALERQLIKEVSGEGVLRFKHIEIQQVFYQNLSQLKRQLMHREAGEALERRLTAEAEAGHVSEALAYHFYQAGVFEKALMYSRQAAAEAQAVYAGQTALFWYTQALDALDQLGQDNSSEPVRFDLLLAREQIYNQLGERQPQAADLAELQMLAQSLDDPVKQALVHNRQAVYERLTGQYAEAMTEAQAGLIAARQAIQPVVEIESLAQLAHVAADRGDFKSALKHLDTAQKIETELEDNESPTVNDLLGMIYQELNDYNQAESYYNRALAAAPAMGHWIGKAAILNDLGRLYLVKDRYLESEALCYLALETNRFTGHRHSEARCLHNLALIYNVLGYFRIAQEYLEQALSIRRAIADRQGEAEDLMALGAIRLAGEDYGLAQQHLESALEIFQTLELRTRQAQTWLELGLLLESTDNLPAAGQAYQEAFQLQQMVGNKAGEIEAKGGLARCLLGESQVNLARKQVEDCVKWLESHGSLGMSYPIRLFLTVYRVLRATRDTRGAEKALHTVQLLLQERAYNVEDIEQRASFLERLSQEPPTPTS